MPGKITSGVAVNDLMANLQTNRTAVVSPFNRLSAVENKEGDFTAGNDGDTALKQAGVNSSELPLEFCNLMQSQPGALVPHQNTFRHMTLTELTDSDLQTDLPPTSKEFKVILFNEALKNHPFDFDSKVIAEIKSGLLSANSPSYKYLASIVISITQAKAALTELKKEGKLNESEFNALNLRLAKYAESLSSVGNNYCRQLAKKPDQDVFTSFLVIRSHKNDGFSRLFKQAENIDKAVKEIVLSHDETKQKITRNLNNVVSQFIVHYFKPEKKENVETFQQLNKYIKPGAYDKIQALFKDESRNRPGHQFDAGGTEHLYDCYAEIFDHFKMYDQFVNDQNTANEPTSNGNPVEPESPITPENFDNGVNDDPAPNGPAANGESADKERPAAPRHSNGGINNHFSPVFNPINSPNFVNNVNGDLLDKLDDNNRLLAKILEQLTKKSSVSRGVQTDDMPGSVDAAVSPMELDIPERRFSAQFADTHQPQKTDKSTTTSTNMVDDRENSGGITGVIVADEIDAPVGQSAVTQLSKYKIAKALSHVTILPRRAQMMDSFQPNVDKQEQHSVDQMKAAAMQTNLLQSRHHGQWGSVQNEVEKVVLKPTTTKSPDVFTVNGHYKERSYYDESGRILPGFVSDRLSAFENRSDVAAFNQKNKVENGVRGVANALNGVIDTAINRANVAIPAVDDSATDLNADLTFLEQKNKIEHGVRGVANALNGVIDTAINRANVAMPAVDDSAPDLNADLTFLEQKNKIEHGVRGVANALNNVIDTAINRANVAMPAVDDTATEFSHADATLIPAKKIFTAERVKNHNYFLDMIKNQRQWEKR